MIERPKMKSHSGGRNRTGALAAYEAAALPLGDPAIEKWHGVSVLPRARGVLEALLRKLAPAAHVVCFCCGYLKIGAVSRTCTGIP